MDFKTFKLKIKRRLLNYTFRINYRLYKKNTIIFESFGGRQISDSPLAIYKKIKQIHPEYRLIWVVNKDSQSEAQRLGYKYVTKGTFKWVRTMKKAHIWVENARQPRWVLRNPSTKIIQTWHGTPLKKLGLDIENVTMPGTDTKRYHENFVYEANRWDELISPNAYSTQIFRQAFGYKNDIMEIGYPRNDELINPDSSKINMIKNHLGIPLSKKVILYAPTYRDNQFLEKGKYAFELPFKLDEMRERFGKDTVLLLRMHYLIANKIDYSKGEEFAIDVSKYENISDLYLISDLLITDYSSVFFDYAYLKRPMIFFPYDYEIYKNELRGFYLDYQNDLPGDIVYKPNELYKAIKKGLCESKLGNNSRFMEFYNRFCSINAGNASSKVIEKIDDYLK